MITDPERYEKFRVRHNAGNRLLLLVLLLLLLQLSFVVVNM